MDQALIFHQDEFGFAVGIIVVFPALGLYVVLEHSASPHRVVDFVLRGTDGVGPDLVHRGVAFVEQGPLAGAGVETAGTSGSCGPHEVALHADSVNDVVA